MNSLKNFIVDFAREDDGAQVIEYALIIAVISIALLLLLQPITSQGFTTFITRLQNCFANGVCA